MEVCFGIILIAIIVMFVLSRILLLLNVGLEIATWVVEWWVTRTPRTGYPTCEEPPVLWRAFGNQAADSFQMSPVTCPYCSHTVIPPNTVGSLFCTQCGVKLR